MKIFPLIFLGAIYVDSISNILAISGFIFYSIYCLVILMVLKMQLLLSNRIVKIIQSYLFFCFLLLLYVIEIYPRFSYVGFNLEFDILLIAISIISIFISTSLLSNSSTASSFVIHVVHYILVLPSILIFTFSAPSVLHSFLILLLVITSYTTTNRRMVIPKIKK